ncbi:hypothetical protein AVEN_80372-1 [Araneus ventricosus]|uniref:Uncharacterized protein n=1 Tax=Araneus ventricosus TaxID=182803 RepID=A0A4Y2THP7_ARAVE|nr:hypothetical protein AVEN_80372-1 [Araneus ventricosus]
MIGEDLQKFSGSRVMRTIAIVGVPIRNLPKSLSITWFSLVLFTLRFAATRGLFWDRPRNFEAGSNDRTDAWAGTRLSKLPYRSSVRAFGPDRFNVTLWFFCGIEFRA